MSKQFVITRGYRIGTKALDVEVIQDGKSQSKFSRGFRYSQNDIHSNDVETLAYNVVFRGGHPFREGDKVTTRGLSEKIFNSQMKLSYSDEKYEYAAPKELKDAFEGMLKFESARLEGKNANPLYYVPSVFNSYGFVDW